MEGEQELVLLEKGPAHHLEQEVREVVRERLQPDLELVALGAVVDGPLEQVGEPLQGVLVHGVDVGHVRDAEEEDGGVERHRLVPLPGLVDLLLGHVGDLLLLGDVVGRDLRLLQDLHGRLVFEDVALAGAQGLQDLVLDLLELPLVLRALDDQLALLLLQVRPLLGHHDAEQLVLEALGRGHEVQQVDRDADLRRVVRVPELGGHVQLELVAVLDHRVAQLDAVGPGLLEDLLLQEGLQRPVDALLNVLDQRGRPERDAVLQRPHVVRVGELHDLQLVVRLHGPDPLVGEALGVDAEGPAAPLVHRDGVLGGELVLGQALDVPRPDLDGVPEDGVEGEDVAAGHLVLLALLHPLDDGLLPVGGREGAQVGDLGGGQQHVAGQLDVLFPQVHGRLGPPDLLPAQAADQLLRPVQLDRAHLHVLLELLLLGLLLLQVGVERGQLVQHLLELGLLHRQGAHDHLEVLLRLGQLGPLGRHHLGHPVVRLHGPHPAAEAERRLGGVLDLLGVEVRVLDVRPDLDDDLFRDVVLVVLAERVQEIALHAHLLGRVPVVVHHLPAGLVLLPGGLDALQHAHGLHHQPHGRGGALHHLDLRDVVLRERVERLQGALEQGHGDGEVVLALVLDGLHGRGLGAGLRLVRLHHHLDLVGGLGLHGDDLHGLLGLLGTLDELRLELDQLLLHPLHGGLRVVQLGEADLVPGLERLDLVLPLGEQALETGQELEVGRRGDVVVPPLGLQELDRELVHGGVEEDAQLHHGVQHVGGHRQVLEDVLGDRAERVLGPRREPVDGGAVHQRRELPQPLAEVPADGGHREDDVEVALDLVEEKRVEVLLGLVQPHLLGPRADVLEDRGEVPPGEQVGHLVRVEQVGDVLDHALPLDLDVREEEHDPLVLLPRHLEHHAEVVVPLRR